MHNDFLTTYNQRGLHNLTEEEINYIIKTNKIDTNKISDGYHSIGKLYEHRFNLFIALCNTLCKWSDSENLNNEFQVWKSKVNYDGSSYEGWFVMGIGQISGKQISYHLPLSRWDECSFAVEYEKVKYFDGHTSDQVLERLKTI